MDVFHTKLSKNEHARTFKQTVEKYVYPHGITTYEIMLEKVMQHFIFSFIC